MTMSAIEELSRSIHKRYLLRRQSRDWLLDDPVLLRMPTRHSIAFSLDNEDSPPFGFLSSNPSEHVAKMCDAIIVACHSSRLYVGLIEQKTGNKDEYYRQLVNGRLFCNWLFSVFKEQGYEFCDLVYVGILVWQPRRGPNKGTSVHSYRVVRTSEHFDCFLELRNEVHIFLSADHS